MSDFIRALAEEEGRSSTSSTAHIGNGANDAINAAIRRQAGRTVKHSGDVNAAIRASFGQKIHTGSSGGPAFDKALADKIRQEMKES